MAQIPGDARVNQYTATASQTVFIYDFQIYDTDEIIVQSDDTTLTLTTQYTVQDAGEAGGTITLVTGADVDTIITLTGNSMIERDAVFTNGGDYLASAINGEYDKLDNITKEIVTDQDGNFRFAVYNPLVSRTVPNPEPRTALVWDTAGTALENSVYDPDEQITLAAAQVVLCEAETAKCEAETAKCEAETALCEAETAKCVALTALAAGYAVDASDSADDAAASAATIDLLALASDIYPDEDGTRNLGKAGKRWNKIQGDQGKFKNSLQLDGANVLTEPIHAQYQYSVAGGHGGGILSDTWTTRPINLEVSNNISGMSLASNLITFPAGSYFLSLGATGYFTYETTYDVYSVLDGTYLQHYVGYLTEVDTNSMSGYITVTSETAVEVGMYGTRTQLSNGMGIDHGGVNIYLDLNIWKVS